MLNIKEYIIKKLQEKEYIGSELYKELEQIFGKISLQYFKKVIWRLEKDKVISKENQYCLKLIDIDKLEQLKHDNATRARWDKEEKEGASERVQFMGEESESKDLDSTNSNKETKAESKLSKKKNEQVEKDMTTKW